MFPCIYVYSYTCVCPWNCQVMYIHFPKSSFAILYSTYILCVQEVLWTKTVRLQLWSIVNAFFFFFSIWRPLFVYWWRIIWCRISPSLNDPVCVCVCGNQFPLFEKIWTYWVYGFFIVSHSIRIFWTELQRNLIGYLWNIVTSYIHLN